MGSRVYDGQRWVEKMMKEVELNRRVTVEDLTQEIQQIKLYGHHPSLNDKEFKPLRPSSPRTLTACLKFGIDPEALVFKPIQWYASRSPVLSKDPQMQQAEYDKAEQIREERLMRIQGERTKILQEQTLQANLAADPYAALKASKDQKVDNSREEMLEAEKKRLAEIEKRTQRDMSRMLERESEGIKVREATKEKEARQQKHLEEAEKARKKREAEAAERAAELAKRRREREREAEEAAQAAKEEHERVKDEQEKRLLAERKERLRQSKQLEQERKQRASEKMSIRESHLKESQEQKEKRLALMELKEAERQAMIARQKVEQQRVKEAQRLKNEARVRGAIAGSKKKEDARRKELEDTMERTQKRLDQQHALLKEQDKQRRTKMKALEQLRAAKAEEARQADELRRQQILSRQERAEVAVQKGLQRRAWEKERKRMQHVLDVEKRQEKVTEIQRAQAYQRHLLKQKIDLNLVKAQKVLDLKEGLQEQRRLSNLVSSMQRQKLNAAIEQLQVRKKWDKIDLKGGQSLDLATIEKALKPSRPGSAPPSRPSGPGAVSADLSEPRVPHTHRGR